MAVRRHRGMRLWLPALLLLALIAAACGGDSDDDGSTGEATNTTAPEDSDNTETDDDEEESLVVPLDTTTTTAPPDDAGAAPETTAAEVVPQSGGTLRVAVEAESDGLNPAANNFAVSAYVMTYPLFDPLAYYDAEGNWFPFLAESFTKMGDGSAWQMKVREGVLFHDGTELDADDVIATFNAQLADPLISLAVRPFFLAEDPIVKVDDYTVEYRAVRPTARMPIYITSQLGMVLPSEWLAQAADDVTLNQMPVGQGPFMIESRVQDEKTVLVRNPNYWAADQTDIYLDRIEVFPITDMAIAAERVASGDIDLLVTSNSEATITLREAGVRTIENERSSESFAMINSTRAPFDDIRARQALTFASDRDTYVELIRPGTASAADTMFHPDLIWHNPDVKQEHDMPDRAAAAVADYCADVPENCSDGRINMELLYSGPSVENVRIAEVEIDAWEDYFNVTQREVLQDDLILQVAIGNFQVVNWRQFGAVDPDNDVLWLECSAIGGISLNWPRYCDPERDALMYEQRASDDLDRRVEIWHELQQRLRDDYLYIFWHHTNWVIGARDNVNDICGQTSPAGVELFCNNQGRVLIRQIWLG